MCLFAGCDRGLVGYQTHLDRDLPRQRICVRACRKELPIAPEPLRVDSAHDADRIVEMIHYMGQDNAVTASWQMEGLKQALHERDTAGQVVAGLVKRGSGGLNAGNVIEMLLMFHNPEYSPLNMSVVVTIPCPICDVSLREVDGSGTGRVRRLRRNLGPRCGHS